MTTVDSLIEGFPKATPTRIVGIPTYENIKRLNDDISANAASIHSELGGGTHGHLGLTVNPTIYATVSGTPYTAPTSPEPPVLTGFTGHQITAANRRYDSDKRKFAEFVALQNALKKQILNSVDDIYMAAIEQPYIGHANRTVLNLITHLYDTYAKISPSDLIQNNQKMTAPWDPNQPFEFLVRQIQDAVDYAAHANTPYTAEQIVNTAYTLVFSTGVFEDECKAWRKRSHPLVNDWPNFKTFFAEAYNDWRETQKQSAGTRYSTANNVTHNKEAFEDDTIAAIANLATATASDRATTARLTETNAQLTAELRSTQDKLVKALEKIALLSSSSGTRQPLKERNTNRDNRPPDRHYCWTHGYLCEHTSGRCPEPGPGHQKFATARKPSGGSQKRKDEWIQRVTRVEA